MLLRVVQQLPSRSLYVQYSSLPYRTIHVSTRRAYLSRPSYSYASYAYPRVPHASSDRQHQTRAYATPTTPSNSLEHLNDLYATARDEFEMAAEETTKKTIYAADDRQAAVDAFQELKTAYEKAVREAGPDGGREIGERIGTRIRELEGAVKGLEEAAMED